MAIGNRGKIWSTRHHKATGTKEDVSLPRKRPSSLTCTHAAATPVFHAGLDMTCLQPAKAYHPLKPPKGAYIKCSNLTASLVERHEVYLAINQKKAEHVQTTHISLSSTCQPPPREGVDVREKRVSPSEGVVGRKRPLVGLARTNFKGGKRDKRGSLDLDCITPFGGRNS